MKKVILILTITVGMFGTSCKKYLDVNTNPNSVQTAGPNLVLPLAIVNTASLISSFNDYGSQTVGYACNAGGYGGFGASWTYDYPTTTGAGYWQSGYYIAENFQYIINNTEGSDVNAYYNATAKIMKAYIFQNLVDMFNDIPYTQALKGDTVLLPTFDKATDIYPQLANLLDTAISEINAAQAPTALSSGTDPLFAGNMTYWKQFANTIKLRLIVRATGVATFANTTFSSDGFLTTDAVVNPGYQLATTSSGQQLNPSWATWVGNVTGSRVGQAWIAARYVVGYYDGHKLTDPVRGGTIYFNYPSVAAFQLGYGGTSSDADPSSPSNAGAWYSGTGSGTAMGNAQGVEKGPNMGEPLMLAAESDFLQAEASLRGIIAGGVAAAKTDFNAGILASFTYLEELPNLSLPSGADPASDFAAYQTANPTSYLVNFDLATSTAQQTEAIITQKYIAMNFISGEEAWNEYRRTGYPTSSTTVIDNPYGSFASYQSQATRPDHLPTRMPYPNTEYATNGNNVPQNISVYTSLIFWAK